nr:FCD domain-containing protein [Synergistales bacterium]
RQICPLLTSEDMFKLQNIMDSEKLAIENEDHLLFAETDRRFHGYFFTKFHNRVMCDIYDNIKDKLAGTDLQAYRIPRKMPFIYQEHMDILDALKSRNSEKVVKTLQVHLENFRNKYIRF